MEYRNHEQAEQWKAVLAQLAKIDQTPTRGGKISDIRHAQRHDPVIINFTPMGLDQECGMMEIVEDRNWGSKVVTQEKNFWGDKKGDDGREDERGDHEVILRRDQELELALRVENQSGETTINQTDNTTNAERTEEEWNTIVAEMANDVREHNTRNRDGIGDGIEQQQQQRVEVMNKVLPRQEIVIGTLNIIDKRGNRIELACR